MKNYSLASLLLFFVLTSFSQKPNISFEESEHNFGDIEEKGGKVSHKFMFTNNGKNPLRILSVKPSCGCTTPDWTKDEIKPGNQGYIIAEYNPKGRPGFFRKSLSIVTNDNQRALIFIKGKVIK
mgnify:FL=1